MFVTNLRFLYYALGVAGLTILASTFYMARHVLFGGQLLKNRNVSTIFGIDRLYLRNVSVYDPKASIFGGKIGEPRRDSCINCFRLPFRLVINATRICDVKRNDQIDILIMITSVQSRRKHRDVIRRTWASITRNNTANIRHVFLFGRQATKSKNELLLKEAAQFKDIVIGDFKDSYRNLTLKTLMGLTWFSLYCSNAKYIFKTDDDMWLSVPKILELPSTYDLKRALAGMCLDVGWPHRSKGSKWYASYLSYPGSTYPGFCTGTAYLMTSRTARAVLRISPHVPFFHLEDVYVALCIQRLSYKLVNIPGFNNIKAEMDPCRYKSDVITSHYVTTADIERAWSQNCSTNGTESEVNVIKTSYDADSNDKKVKNWHKTSDPAATKYLVKSVGKFNKAELRRADLAASFFKVSSDIRRFRRRWS